MLPSCLRLISVFFCVQEILHRDSLFYLSWFGSFLALVQQHSLSYQALCCTTGHTRTNTGACAVHTRVKDAHLSV